LRALTGPGDTGAPSVTIAAKSLDSSLSTPSEVNPPNNLRLYNATISKPLHHDAKLPRADMPLDQALSECYEILSPWKRPLEWMNADAKHVLSIVNDVLEMTQKDGTGFVIPLRPAMIYQVSVIVHYRAN
jgi:hypothetical protein